MMKRFVFGALLVLGTALVSGQDAPIFSMDYTRGSASGGWPGTVPTSATFDREFVPAGGPNGEGAYEFRQRVALDAQGYGGEFYWGWNGNIEPQDPPQGSRRFYRWRMRFSPDTNFRGIHWQDGRELTLTNKILMVGDGCRDIGPRCRVIVSYRGAGGASAELRVALDGGEDPTPDVVLPVGRWLDIQIELDSSSSPSTADGGYKLWVNNNDYSRPTARRVGIVLNPLRWRYVFFGAYENNGLVQRGVHTWRQTGFEAATAFDASFSGRRASPPPPPPR